MSGSVRAKVAYALAALAFAGAAHAVASPKVVVATAAAATDRRSSPVKRFVLVVGCNRPTRPDIATLRYADDDAVRWAMLFRTFGADVELLTDLDAESERLYGADVPLHRSPTHAEVMQSMMRLRGAIERARAEGAHTAFYFVYAGHGDEEDGEGFVGVADGRLLRREIEEQILAASGADTNHVIVDACRSYYIAYDRGPGGRRRPWLDPYFKTGTAARFRNTGFVLASSSGGATQEWEEFQAGIFSHEVRSGLLGGADADGDGRITYAELAAFVRVANQAVRNDRYRPEILARAPSNGDDVLLDLWDALAGRVQIPRRVNWEAGAGRWAWYPLGGRPSGTAAEPHAGSPRRAAGRPSAVRRVAGGQYRIPPPRRVRRGSHAHSATAARAAVARGSSRGFCVVVRRSVRYQRPGSATGAGRDDRIGRQGRRACRSAILDAQGASDDGAGDGCGQRRGVRSGGWSRLEREWLAPECSERGRQATCRSERRTRAPEHVGDWNVRQCSLASGHSCDAPCLGLADARMRRIWVIATFVLASASLDGCISKVPIGGAPCPCPSAGYCCENSVCVQRATCNSLGGTSGSGANGGSYGDAAGKDGGTGGGGQRGGGGGIDGADGPTDAHMSDRPTTDGQGADRRDSARGETLDGGLSADATGGDAGSDGSPGVGEGHIVQPWVDSSPAYARAIVQIRNCSGVVVDQDWVLTARRCGAQLGDAVSSIRTTGSLTTTIDRIMDDWATGDDAEYLHLLQPIADVPVVPFYWGTTDAVVGNAVTCYGYSGTDLWAATLSTRPHADQTTDPNTFETARDGGSATLLPGGAGGPCFS